MSIPSSGQLTFSSLQTEYGGANPIGLGEYYAGGAYVSSGTGGDSGLIPTSGALPIGRFYGSSAAGILWGARFLRPGPNNSGSKIKYINGKFFIMGDAQGNPNITYSSDYTGTSWSSISIPRISNSSTSSLLKDIAWNGSIYVAAGRYLYNTTNGIITSPDLINWTPSNVVIGQSGTGYAIATNGSIFVCPGAANQMKTSPDGITWTVRGITGTVYDVIWNGFVFVGVGPQTVVYSSDGITWSSGSGIGTSSLQTVAWGNNIFVATTTTGGVSYTSPNGVTWTQRTHTSIGTGGSIAYGSGLFVQLGLSTTEAVTSPDGITWTYRSFLGTQTGGFAGSGLSSPSFIKAIGYGTDRFIAAGSGLVVSSTDGLNWTSLSSGAVTYGGPQTIAGLNSIATNGSILVAVGGYGRNSFNRLSDRPTILTSTDGNIWNHSDTSTLTSYTFSFYDVVWTGTRFIAVGGDSNKTGGVSGTLICTSDNGITWTSRVNNNVTPPAVCVAVKGNTVIATTLSTQEWFSSDGGLIWTQRTNTDKGFGIAANSSTFLKVTASGTPTANITVITSTDGTWVGTGNTIPSTTNGYVQKARWVNDRYMLCGSTNSINPFIYYSLDGVTWTKCVIPEALSTTGVFSFYDLGYCLGKYYAVSWRGIFVSTDGVNFSLLSGYSTSAAAGLVPLLGVANTSNKIVTVGNYGGIVTSPPPSSTTL